MFVDIHFLQSFRVHVYVIFSFPLLRILLFYSFLFSPLLFSVRVCLCCRPPPVSSLERSSPVPEGRSRSLRSTRSFGGSSVTVVKMTPLSFLPGTRIIKYLGIINMFFIRETTSLREVRLPQTRAKLPTHSSTWASFISACWRPLQEGGVSGFLHSFIAEVFAMVRAHVAALGGNAVVSYSMKECVLMENPNKNQVRTHAYTHNTHIICQPVSQYFYRDD